MTVLDLAATPHSRVALNQAANNTAVLGAVIMQCVTWLSIVTWIETLLHLGTTGLVPH